MASQIYVNGVTLSSAAEWNKWDTAAYCALTGAAGTNTITATGPANLTSVATNPPLWFIPAATNTGATTINITPSGGAALGAKNVFAGGVACTGGELVINVPVAIVYDGTQYNIVGPTIYQSSTASTFTFDGSGGSTGALTMVWDKRGRFVTLNIPIALATSGTGSTVLTSNTALPAAIRPATAQFFSLGRMQNNGTPITPGGVCYVDSAGIIGIYRDSIATAFTNASVCGTPSQQTIIYIIP